MKWDKVWTKCRQKTAEVQQSSSNWRNKNSTKSEHQIKTGEKPEQRGSGMQGNQGGIRVKCPRFEGETERKILCCSKVHTFSSQKAKEAFMRHFCALGYFRCPAAEPRFPLRQCWQNKVVDCSYTSCCSSCGWDRTVQHKRLEAWKKAYLKKKANKG
jgi:hypothetical protein